MITRIVQQKARVTAIFQPKANLKQVARSYRSICMLDVTGTVQCWGESAEKLSAAYQGAVHSIITDTDYPAHRNNICVLTETTLKCWNEVTAADWRIPASIKAPLSAALSNGVVCVLHEGDEGSEVACLNSAGDSVGSVPALHDPVSLRADNFGGFCVDDRGKAVCWGNRYFGQAAVPDNLGPVSGFAAGEYHNCGITTDECG